MTAERKRMNGGETVTMTGTSCYDCRKLRIENGGNGRIFFRCGATGRVIEAASEKAYWAAVVYPPAWCRGSGMEQLQEQRIGEKGPARLTQAQPSWKIDVLWSAAEREAAYG